MKRRILLVDDELAILLTLRTILEIHGFEVETAASAHEAKQKLKSSQFHMVITDLRMESETAGREVVLAARKATYRPAVAMLTAFPMEEAEGDDSADEVLVKPMNTKDLLIQLEALLISHQDKQVSSNPAQAASASPGRATQEKQEAAGKKSPRTTKNAPAKHR